jgi:hypothetical protein
VEAALRAVETTGTIDEHKKLHLDETLPIEGPMRVRVIILIPADVDDFEEQEWLHAAATSSSFDFLNDPAEDIYTLEDGVPFRDEG